MKFLSWLFRAPKRSARPSIGFQVRPEDPPELRVLAEPRPRPPRKRGRTPEQIAEDTTAYHAALRRQGLASFTLARDRAIFVGSTHYRWRCVGDTDVCETCRKRSGKKFPWGVRPPGGYPGEHECPSGWCRCYAEPIL